MKIWEYHPIGLLVELDSTHRTKKASLHFASNMQRLVTLLLFLSSYGRLEPFLCLPARRAKSFLYFHQTFVTLLKWRPPLTRVRKHLLTQTGAQLAWILWRFSAFSVNAKRAGSSKRDALLPPSMLMGNIVCWLHLLQSGMKTGKKVSYSNDFRAKTLVAIQLRLLSLRSLVNLRFLR